ncbi:MAG: hypothetical protein V4581_14830 [Bacteroidota bacterium]
MKKILTLLVLTLVVATGCKSQDTSAQAKKLAQSEVKYEYRAHTRGSKIDIVISNFGISASKGRPGEAAAEAFKAIPAKEQDILIKETAKINLDGLETLEAPTKKHQFDGALAATFKITVDGKEYQTVTFDHGNPPAEIKPLVEKIIALSGLEKE